MARLNIELSGHLSVCELDALGAAILEAASATAHSEHMNSLDGTEEYTDHFSRQTPFVSWPH
jgi:hypothetical protein